MINFALILTCFMRIDRNTGLVLEGGGMRGVFTSGVLDALMKHDIYFRYTVAVSAGACNGLSYMSRQPRRARISNIDMLAKYDYISIRNLIRMGSIFDPDLLYRRFPDEIVPFDYAEYFHNCDLGYTFEMVTTNCETGLTEYLSEKNGDRQRLINITRASSSLPYVSKVITVDGKPMLDGGIVDSIPVAHSMEMGHEYNVIVTTHSKGWRNTSQDHKLPPFVYRNYPRLRVQLSHRIEAYNKQMDYVDELELAGKAIVIRPKAPVVVGRMEKDISKLEALYEQGFSLGEQFVSKYIK